MSQVKRISEIDVQIAILEMMQDGRVWTNEDLKKAIRPKFQLTPEDKIVKTRGEPVWMQLVNNALTQSPKRPKSLYAKGHVENCGHGAHRITLEGMKFIEEDDVSIEELIHLSEKLSER